MRSAIKRVRSAKEKEADSRSAQEDVGDDLGRTEGDVPTE